MMRLSLSRSVPLALGLAVAACSGDDTPDAGALPDAGPPDSGVVDAGPPDAGVQGPCNPVDGSGCIQAERSCVLQLDGPMSGEGQCRELINPVAHEQQCGPAQTCQAGFACVRFEGDDNPTCRKVCDLREDTGCEGLQGSAASYACNLRPSRFARFGFCAPAAAACDPLDNQCPAMQNCDFVSEGTTGCVPAGATPLGGSCTMDRCRRGGMCVNISNITDALLCYEPCDLQNPTCSQAGYMCGDIGESFGLCVPMQ